MLVWVKLLFFDRLVIVNVLRLASRENCSPEIRVAIVANVVISLALDSGCGAL